MLPAFAALAAIDALYLFLFLDGAYRLKETATNAFTFVVAEGLRRTTFVWRLAAFTALHTLAPTELPLTAGWLAVCYVGIDFTYYWKHRLLHETGLGWSMHSTHHSSSELNLSTAMRTNWLQRILEDAIFAWLTVVGFHPLLVLMFAEVNLFTLTWVHTRIRGRWGIVEYVLNTPAAHRVHHANTQELSSCNYGATFLVWDRLFGTYRAEPQTEVVYGLEEGSRGYNPLRVQFSGMWEFLRSLRKPAIRS